VLKVRLKVQYVVMAVTAMKVTHGESGQRDLRALSSGPVRRATKFVSTEHPFVRNCLSYLVRLNFCVLLKDQQPSSTPDLRILSLMV
jgi:hypothetical protein